MPEVKRLRCACGWEVTGSEDEVVPQVIEHGERLHNMRATREEVLARLEPVDDVPSQ
jgi:predicted small metal-binding protein